MKFVVVTGHHVVCGLIFYTVDILYIRVSLVLLVLVYIHVVHMVDGSMAVCTCTRVHVYTLGYMLYMY